MNNVKVYLRKRKKSCGMLNLYLDVSYGSTAQIDPTSGKIKYKTNRERTNTGLDIFEKPKDAKERKHNKDSLAVAEVLRYQKECKLRATTIIGKEDLNTDMDFYEFFEDYIDNYNKKDIRHLKRALKLFKDFIMSKKKYRCYHNQLDCKSLSENMVIEFSEYLTNKFKGEGPHTVFQRFKKVVKRAVKEGYLDKNPCEGIIIKFNTGTLKKETLTLEEVKKLIDTDFSSLNPEVRKAFLFTLFTGIRGCDIRKLTYSNISYAEKKLKFEQHKVAGRSSASEVVQPLTDFHFELIGKPQNGDKKELIFKLPSDTTCNQQLKDWMAVAGIEKHITWYCARHSFGTNLCEKNVNPLTIMALLGHSSLKYINVYVNVRDKKKEEAMDSICGDFQKESESINKMKVPEDQRCYVKIIPFIKDNEIRYKIKDLLSDRILTDCDGFGFNTEEDARKLINRQKHWIERPLGKEN